MQELIKIHEKDQKQVFSARELYDFLGLHKSQWKRWCEKNITKNPFAIETLDFGVFDIMSKTKEGRPTEDFWITIDFAKRLSMLVRNEKGEEIRRYFIWCENRLKDIQRSVDNLEYLRFDQVLYIIDLINCFKFITHQKAATEFHKSVFIKTEKNTNDRLSTEAAAKLFHAYRNDILNIDPDEVEKRFKRYILTQSISVKTQKTKHEKLVMMDKFEVIGHAVFDFLRASDKVEEISLRIANFANQMSEKMSIEVRQDNTVDLFHDEIEPLSKRIMKYVEPFVKETTKHLNKGMNN